MARHRLAWKDSFIAKIEQEVDGVPEGAPSPFYFGIDGDALVFRFTEQEFIKVYTALKNGCDLTYGDEAQQVLWYFLRNVEYPEVPPPPMSCEDIQNCIETNEGTRETIQDIFDRGSPPNPERQVGGTNDLDELFGFIRFLVDTIHDAILDVFQMAGEESDLRKRIKLLIEVIPGAELLPFDELAEYGDELLTGIGAQFEEQWTTVPGTGSRDRISCGLFCLARNNGNSLTWQLIRDWMWEQVGFESPGLNQFVDFVGYLITGSWSGQDIVNISFANFAAAMDNAGRYGNLVFPSLATLAQLGRNDPDPDWEILCEDCPEPPPMDCTDFADGQGDYLAGLPATVYVPGEGYWNPSGNPGIGIVLPTTDRKVRRVKLRFARPWQNDDDYERYFVSVASYNGSNGVVFPVFPDPLTAQNPLTITAPDGVEWEGLSIGVTAGGYTWPTDPPQYLREVCLNIDD